MNAHFGKKIRLPTSHGDFDVTHVIVHDKTGEVCKEGVVLENLTSNEIVTVRLQSSCLFGESFWATDCDCALQLQGSLDLITKNGGLLLYFYEEGRGAGLEAKFAAIELQQMKNLDTRQAYECLNLKVDERRYEAAAEVLKGLLGVRPVKLLTNNPGKENGLKAEGVNIVKREQLICGWDMPEVRKYLLEKRKILNHDIPLE
jgi:GTP cyclohydrolase II